MQIIRKSKQSEIAEYKTQDSPVLKQPVPVPEWTKNGNFKCTYLFISVVCIPNG